MSRVSLRAIFIFFVFFPVEADIVFLGARENENGLLVWLDGEAVRDQ